jgi:predicted nuclease with TOPRIM domain
MEEKKTTLEELSAELGEVKAQNDHYERSIKKLFAWVEDLSKRVRQLEAEREVIDSAQKKVISDLVDRLVAVSGQTHQSVWRTHVDDVAGVASYHDIKKLDYHKAIDHLHLEIDKHKKAR